jgi:hypothetical protein
MILLGLYPTASSTTHKQVGVKCISETLILTSTSDLDSNTDPVVCDNPEPWLLNNFDLTPLKKIVCYRQKYITIQTDRWRVY